MAKAECPHKTLKKQLTGSVSWYVCANPECDVPRQKFKAEPWDGKVRVVAGVGETKREAFEKWFNEEYGYGEDHKADRSVKDAAWAAWQARSAGDAPRETRCGNCDHHTELHNIHGCTVRIELDMKAGDGKMMVDCPCAWDNLQASDGPEACSTCGIVPTPICKCTKPSARLMVNRVGVVHEECPDCRGECTPAPPVVDSGAIPAEEK